MKDQSNENPTNKSNLECIDNGDSDTDEPIETVSEIHRDGSSSVLDNIQSLNNIQFCDNWSYKFVFHFFLDEQPSQELETATASTSSTSKTKVPPEPVAVRSSSRKVKTEQLNYICL